MTGQILQNRRDLLVGRARARKGQHLLLHAAREADEDLRHQRLFEHCLAEAGLCKRPLQREKRLKKRPVAPTRADNKVKFLCRL